MVISHRLPLLVGRTMMLIASMLVFAVPAHAAFVGLTWDRNPEPEVTGYMLLSGTESGNYTTTVDVGNTTTWTADNLVAGRPVFFAILAYNADGVRSELSNELSVKPRSAAAISAPLPGAALDTVSTFQWSVGNGVSQYRLSVGTTFGGSGVFDQTSTATTASVSGLPASGTIFVRLWSLIGTTWNFTDYTYAAGASPAPPSPRPWRQQPR